MKDDLKTRLVEALKDASKALRGLHPIEWLSLIAEAEAMALRFLKSLDRYEYVSGSQHNQNELPIEKEFRICGGCGEQSDHQYSKDWPYFLCEKCGAQHFTAALESLAKADALEKDEAPDICPECHGEKYTEYGTGVEVECGLCHGNKLAKADAVEPIDTDKVAHNLVEAWLKDVGTMGIEWDDIASLKMRISAELSHDSE
jgi:hypothetical protein